MEKLKLFIPTLKDERDIWSFRQEFFDYGEKTISGSGGLDRAESYDKWFDKIMSDMNRATCPEHLVPATIYVAKRISDGKIVGITQIRHYLNDILLEYGGHIGYSVVPSERRKGYAKEMLGMALSVCMDMKINEVLVTCLKENTGSARTIMANGGILENEIVKDGEPYQRYWIRLEGK